MKRKLICLAGVMTLLPSLALAGHCRDCRDGSYPSGHEQTHRERYDAPELARYEEERAKSKKHRKQHRKHHSKYDTKHDRRYVARRQQGYGRVISVEPVYEYRTQNYESCLRRETSLGDSRGDYRSWTPAILGAVIGTAVGHRVGDSHGDATAAALAGGVLGVTIGRDVARHNRVSRTYTVQGPCRDTRRREYRSAPVEYVVSYRYNNQVYRTHMDHHPGEWVELDVKVKPI